jgi:hypothetical protein
MFARFRGAAAFVIISSLVFAACGKLDTVLPSSGSYRLDASTSASTLNKCSIISQNDEIHPFFVTSVIGDPDVRGLVVYLTDRFGEIAGEKVQYTLNLINGTGENGENEKEEYTFVHVFRLDKQLPAFPLPETLEIGQYNFNFQVIGEKEILYRIEKPVYYVGSSEFSLENLSAYLPGVSRGAHLIPPAITVLLESQIISGEELDPYIVWYSGRKRISEGRVSEGKDRLFWKTPGETGFHTIWIEVFPFKPDTASNSEIKGITRELSLPVSSKAECSGYFTENTAKIAQWYQFRGDLQDSKEAPASEKALRAAGQPRWLPAGDLYGLAIGPGDTYSGSAVAFTPGNEEADKDKKAGRFLLRFKPLSGGNVFTAEFAAESSPSDALLMAFDYTAETLVLRLHGSGGILEIPPVYAAPAQDGFISVFIDYAMTDKFFSVGLFFEEPAAPVVWKTYGLSGPLSGKGVLRFGGEQVKEPAQTAGLNAGEKFEPEVRAGSAGEFSLPSEKAVSDITAILDEFAVAWPENYPEELPSESPSEL